MKVVEEDGNDKEGTRLDSGLEQGHGEANKKGEVFEYLWVKQGIAADFDAVILPVDKCGKDENTKPYDERDDGEAHDGSGCGRKGADEALGTGLEDTPNHDSHGSSVEEGADDV